MGEQELNKKLFLDNMCILVILFGDIDETTVNIYYDIMKKWSNKSFEESVGGVISNYNYQGFPKPAEFLKYKTIEGHRLDE